MGFDGSSNGITTFYAKNESVTFTCIFHNCVFDVSQMIGDFNYSATFHVYNSLVIKGWYGLTGRLKYSKYVNCITHQIGTTYFGGATDTITTLHVSNLEWDESYNITSSHSWKNVGTGLNPNGSVANLGVYGGPYAWGNSLIIDGVTIEGGNVINTNKQDVPFIISI